MVGINWIKVDTNIFENKKIKYLRRLPNGDTLVLVWIMLLTMAGQCNLNGRVFLTEDVPYSADMLADELGVKQTVVKRALEEFEKLNMIERNEGFITVLGWCEHQNIESLDKIREQNRKRQEKYRQDKKTITGNVTNDVISNGDSNATVTLCNANSNVTVTLHNATEKEKEKEEDRECKHSLNACAKSNAKSNVTFERFWKAYPKKQGKKQAEQVWKESDASEHIEDILKALSWQCLLNQWTEDHGRYIPSPSNYIKDRRWQDSPPVAEASKNSGAAVMGKNSVMDWMKKYGGGMNDENIGN